MFKGECFCDAPGCARKAYYAYNGQAWCGIHTRDHQQQRTKLKENPLAKDLKRAVYSAHMVEVEAVAEANRKAGLPGTVIVRPMRMMRPVEQIPGYQTVFPNYRHLGREDGLGCPSLSPMSMGPVHHGQPGLPPARNLENLHQGNKVYPHETDDEGRPDDFYEIRLMYYRDARPHRHKYERAAGAPLYSIWVQPDGTEKRNTYVESRAYYCNIYEYFALRSDSFRLLQRKLADGYNLVICGYDGYNVDRPIQEHYNDPTRPFGHELALYVLLMNLPRPWPKLDLPLGGHVLIT